MDVMENWIVTTHKIGEGKLTRGGSHVYLNSRLKWPGRWRPKQLATSKWMTERNIKSKVAVLLYQFLEYEYSQRPFVYY